MELDAQSFWTHILAAYEFIDTQEELEMRIVAVINQNVLQQTKNPFPAQKLCLPDGTPCTL